MLSASLGTLGRDSGRAGWYQISTDGVYYPPTVGIGGSRMFDVFDMASFLMAAS